jgi:endonuclease/exonuclease/phosphatase family metal-dependent hydrolase
MGGKCDCQAQAVRSALRRCVGWTTKYAVVSIFRAYMSKSAHFRLASYNIQKCVGLDLRRYPRRTVQVIERMRAQIVILQEADKRLPPRPAALSHFVLNEAGWKVADLGGAGSLGWHGNAVIWKSDDLSLSALGHHTLPGFEPRGAVRVEFETPHGPIRVVGMHLGLLSASRRHQIVHLSTEMAKLPKMPTVWAGDFNEWSTQPILDRLAPDMRFLPPVASFPAPRPVGALDRIALSEGIMALDHGVHDKRPASVASDHLPVWADLMLE